MIDNFVSLYVVPRKNALRDASGVEFKGLSVNSNSFLSFSDYVFFLNLIASILS